MIEFQKLFGNIKISILYICSSVHAILLTCNFPRMKTSVFRFRKIYYARCACKVFARLKNFDSENLKRAFEGFNLSRGHGEGWENEGVDTRGWWTPYIHI